MTGDRAERIGHLPHRSRVAFYAACAGRVLRIYELDYSEENRAPHAAVDLAWRFACGEPVTDTEVAYALQSASEATPDVDEEGDEFTAPMHARTAAICALQAIGETTVEPGVVDGAGYAVEAVTSFDAYEGSSGKGDQAEELWQERALALAERYAVNGRPATREMFAVLGDDPPTWYPWRR